MKYIILTVAISLALIGCASKDESSQEPAPDTLAAADVLVNPVHPFHHELARVVIDGQTLAGLSLVVPGDDLNGVVDFDVHYTTSLARLTIFM